MMRFKQFIATLLLAAFAIGFAAGCAQLPTAPSASRDASAVQGGREAESAGLLDPVTVMVGSLLRLVVRVVDIVGSVGGTLTNGRWRVDVPAGAIDGSAAISIGVVSASSPSCQLGITPEDRNHFGTPVRLTASCPDVPISTLKTYVIHWYNPATRTWTPVEGSTVDLTTRTVSAPLQHFSTYAVGPAGGRAGW